MALPKRGILDEQVEGVKAMLWEGEQSQREIGAEFGVSQGTVSNILRGHIGRLVKWPDGSLGEMPLERYKSICWARNMKPGKRVAKYAEESKYSPLVEQAAVEVEKMMKGEPSIYDDVDIGTENKEDKK